MEQHTHDDLGNAAFFRSYHEPGVDRLSETFSTIARALKRVPVTASRNGFGDRFERDVALLPSSARELADYITRYLSTALNRPYAALGYDPGLGRLHPGRVWEEALVHIAWRSLDEAKLSPQFDLQIGAHDLCFCATFEPSNRNEQVAIYNALVAKGDSIRDRMWDNSLRFLPEADEKSWRNWGKSWRFWLPSMVNTAPKRFGVMIEASAVQVPVPPGRIAYHVSDSVKRFRSVLDLF
ncbi:MAG: hypothetical protein AAF234_09560 [Pseudomonadota bacterium]